MTSKRYHSKLKTSELEKAFRDADKDRDGCLTQQEYFKVRHKQPWKRIAFIYLLSLFLSGVPRPRSEPERLRRRRHLPRQGQGQGRKDLLRGVHGTGEPVDGDNCHFSLPPADNRQIWLLLPLFATWRAACKRLFSPPPPHRLLGSSLPPCGISSLPVHCCSQVGVGGEEVGVVGHIAFALWFLFLLFLSLQRRGEKTCRQKIGRMLSTLLQARTSTVCSVRYVTRI